MRLVSLASALLLFCCSLSNGQATNSTANKSIANTRPAITSTANAVATDDSQLSPTSILEQKIYAALKQPADFDFDERPWGEIEADLETHHGINIVLTHSAKDDSLSPDEPITVNLAGVPLKSALTQMLESKNATWIVKDGVLKIISLDDAEDVQYFTTRFINVRTLLANISKLESSRIGTPRVIRRKHAGGKMAGGPGQPQEEVAGVVTAESMLIDLIQTSIYPDRWQDSGQGLATIKIIGGYTVVNCPNSLADSLENFLGDLSFHLSRE